MVSGLLLAMHAIAFNYGTANGNLVDSLELLGSYEGTGWDGHCVVAVATLSKERAAAVGTSGLERLPGDFYVALDT